MNDSKRTASGSGSGMPTDRSQSRRFSGIWCRIPDMWQIHPKDLYTTEVLLWMSPWRIFREMNWKCPQNLTIFQKRLLPVTREAAPKPEKICSISEESWKSPVSPEFPPNGGTLMTRAEPILFWMLIFQCSSDQGMKEEGLRQ